MPRTIGLCELTIAVVLALLGLTGCSPAEGTSKGPVTGTLQVIATTGMIADMATRIGGDAVEVTTLAGPGVDPHLYQPTRKDLQRLRNADLVLFNGLALEGRVHEALEQMPELDVLAVAEQLPKELLLPLEEGGEADTDHADPHVWLDVGLWARAVPVVTERIARRVPEAVANTVRKRGSALREELQELDEVVRNRFAAVPSERRTLVTAHDAFRYFARAYGVTVHAVQGISTQSEAGLADINQLVNTIVASRIPVIFAETIIPEKAILAVIEGAKDKGHNLRRGTELYSDALGTPSSGADTYARMIRHNVDAIAGEMEETGN